MKCPKCQSDNPDTSRFCAGCGTQLIPKEEISVTETLETPKEELSTGATFANRYEIIEELGKGGMGKVYRALDKELNEEVAIKLIKPEIAAEEKTIERFKNELKLARRISHRYIGRVYELMEEEGKPFITMEYVAGEDLKSLISEKVKLTEEEAISIAKQVCEGLSEAHELGVIHRDLKPKNIMIDKKNKARIMDFGIAHSVEAPGVTTTGVIIGTPDYISPEQAEGEEADQRSDIYAVGIMLYEMVTGSVPFKGDTALSVALKHKTQLPLDPRKLNKDISEDLSRLILVCMEKDRERRYQTAEDLLADLRNIEEGFPLGSKIRPRRETFVAALIRKKLFIPALVVALAIIAVVTWQLLPQKEPVFTSKIENSIAVISFENQTGDEAYDYLQKAIPNLLITSLEQSRYLSVTTWERMQDLIKQIRKDKVEIIDRDLGFELCRMDGINAIVIGSFVKAGEMFAIDVKVLDVETKSLLKSSSAKGEGAASILKSQIDELSKEISKSIGIPERKIVAAQQPIADVTTTSMEAYNYFLRGREDYDKSYFKEALQFFEKAVELDPNFAIAYSFLGWTYRRLGDTKARDRAFEKAQSLSKKTTDKERLYIEAAYAQVIEKDKEKRIKILQQIIRKYSKEKRAHYNLAIRYWEKKLFSRAIEEYNKAIELDPNFGPAYNGLAYIYKDMGNYEKAIENLKKFAFVSPGDADPFDSMAELYFVMGNLDEALEKYKEALSVKPNFFNTYWKIAYMYALKDDFFEALKWIDQYIDVAPSPAIKAEGFVWKGFYNYLLGSYSESYLNLNRGAKLTETVGNEFANVYADWLRGWLCYDKEDFEACQKHFKSWFESALKYSPPVIQLPSENFYKAEYNFYTGLLNLKLGQIDSARLNLVEMSSLLPSIDPGFKDLMVTYNYELLNAEVLYKEKDEEKAIDICKKLLPLETPPMHSWIILLINAPFPRDVSARAYRRKGELDNAIAEYERLITFNPKSKVRRGWLG